MKSPNLHVKMIVSLTIELKFVRPFKINWNGEKTVKS